MVIAFCGHSKYSENKEDERKIFEIIENKINDNGCEFFLGEYGAFDKFCYKLTEKIKKEHSNIKLVFVTPYIEENYLNNKTSEKNFDLIIYPELENIHPKYRISYRNKWIVEKVDCIIAYVKHKYGGAYAMYKYAKKIGKDVYNIAEQKAAP